MIIERTNCGRSLGELEFEWLWVDVEENFVHGTFRHACHAYVYGVYKAGCDIFC